jgi:pyrroloquinoline quinone biosynthesis protein B
MRVVVLGAAAGGGLPQWNCGCEHCRLARAGDARVGRRTQDSVAVSGQDGAWLLLNASPDVLRQMEGFAPLHPRSARDTPVAGVALTNGDLDHVLGLYSMRESQPLVVYATERVRAGLVDRNAMTRTFARTREQLTWRALVPGGPEVEVTGTGLALAAVAMPGKLPIHLGGLYAPSAEDNVALRVRDARSGRSLVYATAVGAVNDAVLAVLDGADAVLFDGTFWSEDELCAGGFGRARARDMAHVPVGGADGSLARLRTVRAGRRVFTHVNNTNPMVLEGSPARAAVQAAGWEVAYDGMEIAL